MCANLYEYHDKSMVLRHPPPGVGVWGPGWVWLVLLIFRMRVRVGMGMKALFRFTGCSLATAQHLRGALVGLVNPGLVGIGLQGRGLSGETDDEGRE